MNDTVVTVMGNVVAEPRHQVTANGIHVANIRLASTSRKFDRGVGEWRDNHTMFFNVSCWRTLAGNVVASVKKGDPLVVTGRLRMNSYTSEAGETRTSPEIDANTVGHDLGRGVAHFQKAKRYIAPERRAAAATEPDSWESEPGAETADETPDGLPETPDGHAQDGDTLTESPWADPSDELARLTAAEEPAAA